MRAFVVCWLLSIVAVAYSSTIKNSNCVAFRLDDIQDWYLSKMQMAVMDVFRVNKTPITAGIIANRFNIGDPNMIQYIKEATQVDGWDFEVCNHGLYHEPFDNYTLDGQIKLLSEAKNKTLRDLSGYITEIPTFIPPHNAINKDTITALKKLGFKYLSAMVQTDPGPHPTTNTSFYHWPIASSTADLYYTAAFIGIPWQLTFADIQKQMNESGFAAVMMHPMEFGSYNSSYLPLHYVEDIANKTMFRELELLLEAVRNAGYDFCTLGGLADKFNNIGRSLTTSQTQFLTTSESEESSHQATSSNIVSSSSSSRITTGFINTPRPTELWVKQFTITIQIKGSMLDRSGFASSIAVASGLPSSLGSFVEIVSSLEIYLPSDSTEQSVWMIIFHYDPSKSHEMPIAPYEVDNRLQNTLVAGFPLNSDTTVLSSIVMDANIIARSTTGYLEPVRYVTSAQITTTTNVDNEVQMSGQPITSILSVTLLFIVLLWT